MRDNPNRKRPVLPGILILIAAVWLAPVRAEAKPLIYMRGAPATVVETGEGGFGAAPYEFTLRIMLDQVDNEKKR